MKKIIKEALINNNYFAVFKDILLFGKSSQFINKNEFKSQIEKQKEISNINNI